MTPDDLKKVRTDLNLTQRQIADEMDLSERFWIYREKGRLPIPRWLARAVRDLFTHRDL